MWLKKDMLPPAPPGTVWSLHQYGDSVHLRLHTKGMFGKEIGRWSTDKFSRLTPDPVTALIEVATQMAAGASGEKTAAA